MVTIYRAATHIGRARTFHVSVDGRERGTVQGSQRLDLALSSGGHTFSAHYGSHPNGTATLNVDLPRGGEPTLIVIDVVDAPAGMAAKALALRLTASDTDKASARGGVSSFVGAQSAGGRIALAVALVLLVGGRCIAWVDPDLPGLSLLVSLAGAVTLVVFGFRKLLYRENKTSRQDDRRR